MVLILLMGALLVLMLLGVTRFSQDHLDPLALFTFLYSTLFVVRPFLLISGLDEPTHPFLFSEPVAHLSRHAVLLFIATYIAFVTAYVVPMRTARLIGRNLPGAQAIGVRQGRLEFAAICLVILAISTWGFLVVKLGGLGAFMYASRHGLFSGMFVLAKLPIITSIVTVLLFLVSFSARRRRGLAVVLVLTSAAICFGYGDRGSVIYMLLTLLIGFHLSIARVRLRSVVATFIACAVLLVAAGTVRRQIFSNPEAGIRQATTRVSLEAEGGALDQVVHSMNLKSFDHFLVVLQDFDYSSFHYGRDYVNAFLGIIPRSLWENKPKNISLGGWFRDTYMPGTGGKPFTGVGEWWINFGVVGVVIAGVIGGLFFRGVWEYCVTMTRGSPWAAVFYATTFLGVFGWGLFGTTSVMQAVYKLLPLIVLYKFILVPRKITASVPSNLQRPPSVRAYPAMSPRSRQQHALPKNPATQLEFFGRDRIE